ncbi:RNA-binding S4 domain-containing protein [Sphingomonas sp. ASY06-1R]|uniref:RNA-binding S4 domain-containing protein n=1 Tax=Sphingomonas sp. ASY06-1R TaxID=3445771 RepID=UPI003FA1B778
MRLDKYLFFTRLVKTRTLAQRIVEGGHVRINSRPIERAHADVRPGMVLTFPLNDRVRVLRVEAIPVRRGPPAEAQGCYTDLAPPTTG